jgi:two-component system, OmpR family, phosphate regulon sensor histidine kinase PhoR
MSSELLDEKLVAELPPKVVRHIELLERMRKDFVANVSHELRTPLTVVIGYLEALIEQASGDSSLPDPIYQKMLQQTLRMQNIIEDLLALSRIEADEVMPMGNSAIDITALLSTIMQHAEPLIHDKQQEVSVDVEEGVMIVGHQDELHSLFSNIIFNAIKYTPKNGKIHIHWYRAGEQAIFSVKDTGIGIAAKHIPRLTERFYRVDKGRSRESGGTGLGLAIAKHVLLRHNGVLEIDSEEGNGSVFRCVFPLAA